MRYKRLLEIIKAIPEKPILTAFLVLVGLAIIILSLSFKYYTEDYYNFVGQVLAEAHGMLFDIAVIGILIYWLNENGEKRLRINMYKDEIDDFRLWESEEAAFRTVGNIKRLNRHNITSINLVNCYLAKTNLSYVNLSQSNLNSANITHSNLVQCNLENARMNRTSFENSNLNQAYMQKAYASGTSFKDAYMIKVNLENAFLIKANFENAFLMEANLNGANLTGANFENANLYKADFRNAVGLVAEQLANVKTLHMAQFDDAIMAEIKQKYESLLIP